MNDWFGGVSFSRLEWSGVGGGGVAVDGLVDWVGLSCVTVRIIRYLRGGGCWRVCLLSAECVLYLGYYMFIYCTWICYL